MPSFTDVLNGNPAQGSDVQQIVDALKGTAGKGIPLAPTAVNDAINFAVAVKNNESGASKALIVYKADGTVLLQVDKNGVVASPDGTLGASQIATLTGAQTFTNKTLTAPHLTAAVVDSGGLAITVGNLAVNASLTGSAGILEGSTALTGTTQIGIQAGVAGTSGATAEVAAFRAIPQTAAAAFTAAEVTNFHATNPIKGAGSTITAATGLTVDSITVGTTKNIGVRVNPPSGATVNAGANIGGDVILGGTALATALATNAVVGFVWIPYSAGTPTGTPSGFGAALDYTGRAPMQFDTTNNKLWVHNGTAWKGVVLA